MLTQRLALVLFSVLFAGTQVRPELPGDFDFRFRFGHCSTTDELDTFTGWFTRQLADGGTEMVQLSLTADQTRYLYEKVQKINFFNYPSTFRGETPQPPIVTNRISFPTYQLDVRSNGRMHSVQWDDDEAAMDPQADGLRRLFGWAVGFILENTQVSRLPPAAKYCGKD